MATATSLPTISSTIPTLSTPGLNAFCAAYAGNHDLATLADPAKTTAILANGRAFFNFDMEIAPLLTKASQTKLLDDTTFAKTIAVVLVDGEKAATEEEGSCAGRCYCCIKNQGCITSVLNSIASVGSAIGSAASGLGSAIGSCLSASGRSVAQFFGCACCNPAPAAQSAV